MQISLKRFLLIMSFERKGAPDFLLIGLRDQNDSLFKLPGEDLVIANQIPMNLRNSPRINSFSHFLLVSITTTVLINSFGKKIKNIEMKLITLRMIPLMPMMLGCRFCAANIFRWSYPLHPHGSSAISGTGALGSGTFLGAGSLSSSTIRPCARTIAMSST